MKLLTPIAFVAMLALAAAPAQAQQRRGGGGSRDGGGHQSAPGGNVTRGASSGAPSRGVTGGGPSRAVSGGGPYRGVSGSHYYPVYRGGVYVAPRIVGPRVYYGGVSHFYSPYYSFRPHVSVGFGLWLGYPVTYPYYYGYPYGYPYPYPPAPYGYGYARPYGYPAQPYYPPQPYTSSNQSAYPSPNDYPNYGASGQNYPAQQSAPSIGVQRGDQSAPGGVSFEITPDTAAVFVDGTYMGTAREFSPTSQPLGLVSGHHRIEIRASGYRTMTFETDIVSGQVLPYQGTLQRN